MKKNLRLLIEQALPPKPASRKRQKGVAIVTVLSIMVLMTILVLSFFSMATSEQISAKGAAEMQRNSTLRDAAVNLAIGQIRRATTFPNTTWVSFPGGITTINAQSGALRDVFKLYSASSMVAPGNSDLQSEDIPGNWDDRPDEYVDINRPIFTSSPTSNDPSQGIYDYPIVDPNAYSGNAAEDPEGFSFEEGVTGVSVAKKSLPMPVRWLYTLKDGTIGFLEGGTFKSMVTSGESKPSKDNPIVGRMAFWTDDESCKINVNTAAEGVYWDTPRTDSEEDRSYGKKQPANKEFQRYPGHPAMVCMSSVLFPGKRYAPKEVKDNKMTAMSKEELDLIYNIAPLVSSNDPNSTNGALNAVNLNSAPPVKLQTNDHLFPSFEELYFKAKLVNNKREPWKQDNNLLKRLGRAQFFLTTKSAAPEISAFGHPRISLWPLHQDVVAGGRQFSVFDEVIHSFTSVGAATYYVGRRDHTSRHNEFYVNYSGRNEKLLQYLVRATDKKFPGTKDKGSFFDKYDDAGLGDRNYSDRTSIMLQMLDMIRGVNMGDRQQYAQNYGGTSGQHAAFCFCGGASIHSNVWCQKDKQYPKGLGRMVGISEFAFVFQCPAVIEGGVYKGPAEFASMAQQMLPLGNGTKLIEVGVIVEGFVPNAGMATIEPNVAVALGGGVSSAPTSPPTGLTLDGKPLELSKQAAGSSGVRPTGSTGIGGSMGVRAFANAGTDNIIRFKPIIVKGDATTLNFSGSDSLRLMVFDDKGVAMPVGNLVQVYYFKLPPIPSLPAPSYKSDNKSLQMRMAEASNAIAKTRDLFDPSKDCVQSIIFRHGDYRLAVGPRAIREDIMIPHPQYGKARMAHCLFEPELGPLNGASASKPLIAGVTYPPMLQPDLPLDDFAGGRRDAGKRGSSDPSISGDFDNGISNQVDGSFTSRPDDGDTRGMPSKTPYFDTLKDTLATSQSPAAFIPNRILSSAGIFGSISTGIQARVPWQTLLFRPDHTGQHYGAKANLPKDHLLMDLFWMPVVEPWSISEPFATKGKLNLNCGIVPFRYIKRQTALHALFKAERLLAIPTGAGATYKSGGGQYHHYIDAKETLKQWDDKFSKGELFRTASEICEMYLVPEGEQLTGMKSFWNAHKLTGDNVRERPYSNFVSRLTVRSNVFRIHYITQTIQMSKSALANPDKFDSKTSLVTSESRGSVVLERSVDPTDPDLAKIDYITDTTAMPIGGGAPDPEKNINRFYSYRITEVKQFAP